jgi:hypothetical protein
MYQYSVYHRLYQSCQSSSVFFVHALEGYVCVRFLSVEVLGEGLSS